MPNFRKSFSAGAIRPFDSVRVIDRNSPSHQLVGKVSQVKPSAIYRGRSFCSVELSGVPFTFSCDQLEKVASREVIR